MKPTAQNLFRRRERGATLLVALIFLVIMATLGTTLANVSGLEERMAGNTRDRDLALQAAEAALADAAAKIQSDVTVRANATAFVPMNANSAAYWEACFKNKTSPCLAGSIKSPDQQLPISGAGAVASQPQYVIESLPPDGATQVYRVTARGVGGNDQTVVVLQAEYGYTTT